MTGSPQEDDRRPAPGASQPFGQAVQPYGQPQPPVQPPQRTGPGPTPDFNRPYGQPPAAPGPYGPPGQPGPPRQYGQSYGAPYGPGAGAPVRKSRGGLIAAVTGLILVLIAGGVVAALTLGSRVLDPAAVERDVGAQFEQLEGVKIRLDCPDDMKLQSGAEYTCTGTTADGEKIQLAIQITDPPGDAKYTWTEQ
jgi:hypothetical protein